VNKMKTWLGTSILEKSLGCAVKSEPRVNKMSLANVVLKMYS